MSGLFNILNTANKGLFAQQTALHTTVHNISNANTEGYTRQRVEMKADNSYTLAGIGQLGTGVKMDSIVRLANDYISKQIRNETGTLDMYTAKSEVIDQLEVIFNEPSTTGLNFYLGEMFDSWQELSKNPENLTSKNIVVKKSEALADTINHMVSQINSLKHETVGQLEKNALDFNSIIDSLESLNQQIMNISIGGQVPNDLLDDRDLMLKDLAGIADFNSSFDEYGRVAIKYNNGDIDILGLNNETEIYELSVVTGIKESADGNTLNVMISKGGDSLQPPIEITVPNDEGFEYLEVGKVIFTNKAELAKDVTLGEDQTIIRDSTGLINSGKIKGNTEALVDIEGSLESIKRFSVALVEAVNTIHTDGQDVSLIQDDGINPDTLDRDGSYYFNFFTIDEDTGEIKVNDTLQKDPSRVWVGKNIDGPEGDGSRALAIARLRDTRLDLSSKEPDYASDYNERDMSITDVAGGITIEDAYGNIVINIGISKEHSDNKISNQNVLLGQLEMRRESNSGVSIDEEVTNIIKYQKAYEANARVISVLSEMLDVLINRTGV